MKSRLRYGMYSRIAGTGAASAPAGSQIRAAIQQPSDIVIHTFSISVISLSSDAAIPRPVQPRAASRIPLVPPRRKSAPDGVRWQAPNLTIWDTPDRARRVSPPLTCGDRLGAAISFQLR